MVQWNSNVDALLFKQILRIHDIKIDWKALETAMRKEGVDVTAKALMHRITKMKTTMFEPPESGKANPFKSAKRGADGKPKEVQPDPESEPEIVDEIEKPKAKKPKKLTKAKDMPVKAPKVVAKDFGEGGVSEEDGTYI